MLLSNQVLDGLWSRCQICLTIFWLAVVLAVWLLQSLDIRLSPTGDGSGMMMSDDDNDDNDNGGGGDTCFIISCEHKASDILLVVSNCFAF